MLDYFIAKKFALSVQVLKARGASANEFAIFSTIFYRVSTNVMHNLCTRNIIFSRITGSSILYRKCIIQSAKYCNCKSQSLLCNL